MHVFSITPAHSESADSMTDYNRYVYDDNTLSDWLVILTFLRLFSPVKLETHPVYACRKFIQSFGEDNTSDGAIAIVCHVPECSVLAADDLVTAVDFDETGLNFAMFSLANSHTHAHRRLFCSGRPTQHWSDLHI